MPAKVFRRVVQELIAKSPASSVAASDEHPFAGRVPPHFLLSPHHTLHDAVAVA
jgi:hypothetical protein